MELIEPSDTERAEWPEATKDYVFELEGFYDAVKPLIKEFEDLSQYYYGKHAGFCDAAGRLKEATK